MNLQMEGRRGRLNIQAEDGSSALFPNRAATRTLNLPAPSRSAAHQPLTAREEQVLRFIAEGLTNRQIAQELRVSVKTVEKHRQEMMNRIGIHHTAGLTCYALANGIVFPETVSASIAKRVPSSRGNWSSPVPEAASEGAITPRETQVLQLIAKGLVNKQIAAELRVSIKTVVNHRSDVMKRLNIHHIAGLTRYAICKAIVGLGTPPATCNS